MLLALLLARARPGPVDEWPACTDLDCRSAALNAALGSRDECRFRAAERVVAARGVGALPKAVDLMCSGWVAIAFEPVPGAPLGPVRGDLLDHLPPRAEAHVRAAAATRWVVEHPGKDVSALAQALEEALARRGPVAADAPALGVVPPVSTVSLWPSDLPGEEQIPATWGRGTLRRPTSSDPTQDTILAAISAIGQAPGEVAPRALFRLLADPDAPPLILARAQATRSSPGGPPRTPARGPPVPP